MKLRTYQEEAVDAAYESIRNDRSSVVAAPTGSGKSLMIAALAHRIANDGESALILTHRKELISQNEKHLGHFDMDVSVYSAGLKRRETDGQILIAGIASIYRKPEIWADRSTVIIDEAHLIPISEETMYGQVLAQMPQAPKIGFTATPYRLDDGLIYGHGQWFSDLAYQIEAKQLVADGYLAPLVGKVAANEASTDGARIRAGDFVTADLEQSVCDDGQVRKAVREAIQEATGRDHILVFAVSILHAQMIHEALTEQGEAAVIVHSKLGGDLRDIAIDAFRAGDVRWCINVGILTTGFDFPALDCIVALRPTTSKALHVQMLGRGMRNAEGKADCLVLDFSANCMRHGDIDLFDVVGKTQEREEKDRKAAAAKRRKLPAHVLQAVDPMHGLAAPQVVKVYDISYKTTPAKRYPDKNNVMAIYKTEAGTVRKWLCPEYETGAKWYAKRFAAARGITEYFATAKHYINLVRAAPQPTQIGVRRGQAGYLEVVVEYFD